MTNQHHPLTNEICEQISRRGVSVTTSIERDNMRAATDWQLEQVIKWFKQSTSHYGGDCLYFDNHYDLDEGIENVLKKAMRPQENN